MAFLRQRYRGSWYLVDKTGQKYRSIKLGVISFAEAKACLRRYEEDSLRLKLGLESDTRLTFQEIVDHYLEWVKHQHKAFNTIKGERDDLMVFAKSLGLRRFASLEPEDFERAMVGLKPRSIRHRINSLRALYRFAKEKRYVRRDPSLLLKKPKIPKAIPRYLDRETIERLFFALDGDFQNLAKSLYYTGLRPSELLRLQVRDIDLKAKEIVVFSTEDRLTKNKRVRKIPIHSALARVISSLIRNKAPADWLFPSKHPSGHRISIREAFMRASKEIGLKVTPYQLRHSFGTHLLNATGDLRLVGQLMGHQDLNTTAIYAHSLEEKMRRGVNAL